MQSLKNHSTHVRTFGHDAALEYQAEGRPSRQPAVLDGDESGVGPEEEPAGLHRDAAAEQYGHCPLVYRDVALDDALDDVTLDARAQ